MKYLEKIRSTRDRRYCGRPRVTEPNQDREIDPTQTENRFGSVVHTAGAFNGWNYPRITAKTGLRCLREN